MRWSEVFFRDDGMQGSYADMVYEVANPWCWACGRDEREPPPHWSAPWTIDRAHIGSGGGSCMRVEDRRCVVLLCRRCHMLHSGAALRDWKDRLLPRLHNSHTLWLKQERDGEFYDPGYLARWWVGVLPDPLEPPRWFMVQYEQRRGGRGDALQRMRGD